MAKTPWSLVDWRFSERDDELASARYFAYLVRENHAFLIERFRKHIWRDVQDDEGDVAVASHEEGLLDRGISARFLAGGVLMTSWAAYEAAIVEFADFVSNRMGASEKLDRGFKPLDQMKKHFREVLGIAMHPSSADWARLRRIEALRNVYAHASGYMPDARGEPMRRRVHEELKRRKGVRLDEDGYVIISPSFAYGATKFLVDLATELRERVCAAYPDKPK